ncbi:MAG: hypothetical protein ACJASR_002024, partial [Psychroserpens sp.]
RVSKLEEMILMTIFKPLLCQQNTLALTKMTIRY